MAATTTVSPSQRKAVLKVLFISLLLDLISFTFILPLFPSLLTFYRNLESNTPNSLLTKVLHYLNTYKNSFSIPINAKYDIILLGGALGSLFSLLQAIASPIIGRASDKYGRRTALLWSMCGNIASVALWCCAVDFRTFLLSRVVGGLSEGNVQLALAIATDISDETQRSSTMALVGAVFSIAFTFGPALGAALAQITTVAANPFATAAGFSLFLIVTETVYLYFKLPETLPILTSDATSSKRSSSNQKSTTPLATTKHTNPPILLNTIHFFFLLPFSGLEFSLPFLITSVLAPNHPSPSKLNGRMLAYIGLIAAISQGTFVRRLPSSLIVRIGTLSCTVAFFLLAYTNTNSTLYLAATLLSITSATVVTGLNSLGSFEANASNRGQILGKLRSWGQFGRALGPIVFCSLFWWMGREKAYLLGGVCMTGVTGLVWTTLRQPDITVVPVAKRDEDGHGPLKVNGNVSRGNVVENAEAKGRKKKN